MSYTYVPGERPDALSILRDKGLLVHSERPAHTPGKFLLDLHSHRLIGEDGKVVDAPPREVRLRNQFPAASARNGLAQGESVTEADARQGTAS